MHCLGLCPADGCPAGRCEGCNDMNQICIVWTVYWQYACCSTLSSELEPLNKSELLSSLLILRRRLYAPNLTKGGGAMPHAFCPLNKKQSGEATLTAALCLAVSGHAGNHLYTESSNAVGGFLLKPRVTLRHPWFMMTPSVTQTCCNGNHLLASEQIVRPRCGPFARVRLHSVPTVNDLVRALVQKWNRQ